MNKLKANPNTDELTVNWLVAMPDKEADNLLIEKVSYEMRKKLTKKRKEGRGGWHTPQCLNEDLIEMLKQHIDKGDMIDVINLAGMILCRQSLYGKSA